MLANSFQTPAALGISDVEFEALEKVLGMLERGELSHGPFPRAKMDREGNQFNMAALLDEGECGTIGCLMGWAYHVSHRVAFAYSMTAIRARASLPEKDNG